MCAQVYPPLFPAIANHCSFAACIITWPQTRFQSFRYPVLLDKGNKGSEKEIDLSPQVGLLEMRRKLRSTFFRSEDVTFQRPKILLVNVILNPSHVKS